MLAGGGLFLGGLDPARVDATEAALGMARWLRVSLLFYWFNSWKRKLSTPVQDSLQIMILPMPQHRLPEERGIAWTASITLPKRPPRVYIAAFQ